MRLLDDDHDCAIKNLLLLLTPTEAHQLVGYLEDMFKNDRITHAHIDDEDYKHELTIAFYDGQPVASYSERVNRLITDDE